MHGSQQGPRTQYEVVVNGDQRSVWPVGGPLPAGWWRTGTRGPLEACLRHVEDAGGRNAREGRGSRRDPASLTAPPRLPSPTRADAPA
jgi:uncharacterized protein YbdZ (MbtH family)